MTEIREKIAELRRIMGIAICPLKDEAPEFYKDCVEFNSACPEDCPDTAAKIDSILAIPEIKEGQELLEKAKSGVLVELDEDQESPSVDDFYQDWGGNETIWEEAQDNMKRNRFRRVRALDGMVCSNCEQPSCPGNMVFTGPDPFDVEINDDDRDRDLCETCYTDRQGDI